ncbi:hypothetical protein [Rheinheimera nanhaiensis]|uniref:Uncharacterized protein n=1 Tax=Rheinheimera nanhaiensis E407-8 TaxID=562729 RepID=I1E073_9GAMM|nr:hypothetical protein [Rheinheimera nanhaiensis]GAB59701.1 hypothetical protein RNAN_2707 [Rheinheimera nanhaiensis E407-8]
MKKFFWLVVIILLLITFSDHDLIRPYKEQLFELVLDKAAIAADDNEAALRRTRKQLLELSAQWGEGQRAQLEKASSSLESLQRFRRDYCVNKDFNPILFGEPLRQSCSIIENNYHNLTKP